MFSFYTSILRCSGHEASKINDMFFSTTKPTCAPSKLQVLRLLRTLCETVIGGWGARLFLGISAGKVLEEEMLSEFIWTTTHFLRPGEAGALAAPSYREWIINISRGGVHSSKADIIIPTGRQNTISCFFFLLLNKLKNPLFSFHFFSFLGRSRYNEENLD